MKTINAAYPIILSIIFLLLFGVSSLFFYLSNTIQNIRNLNQQEIIVWNNIHNNINFLFKSDQEGSASKQIQKRVQAEIHNLLNLQQDVEQEIFYEAKLAERFNILDWSAGARLSKIIGNKVDRKVIALIESVSQASPTLIRAGLQAWDTELILSLQSRSAFAPLLNRENNLAQLEKRNTRLLWYLVGAASIIILTVIWLAWLKIIKPAFNRVRNSREQLFAIWKSIGEGVLTLDGEGCITDFNPKASEFFHIKNEQLGKLHLYDLISEDCKKKYSRTEMVKTIIANPYGERGRERLYLQPFDGDPFPVSYSVSPLIRSDKKRAGAVFVFRDITDEEALRSQSAQTERLRSLGLLIGGIAHDFNNLLAGISGATEILQHKQSKKLNEREKSLLSIISTQVDRGVDLTTKLTEFSKNKAEHYTRINLLEVVDDVVKVLEQRISDGVSLSVNNETEKSFVKGNRGRLQSAIINLCLNAIHAVDDNGKITITIRSTKLDKAERVDDAGFPTKPGEYIEVEITDDGFGISESNLNQIFDPFFTTKPTGEGSGLGLSAAYGVARDHGGMITATSTEGAGSTFVFKIPIGLETPEVETTITPSLEPSIKIAKGKVKGKHKVKHALVIEDEDAQRENYSQMLKILGYVPKLANGGVSALKILIESKEAFDLVLLDVNMPDLNGVEVFSRITKKVPKENIVIITGHTSAENIMALRGNGADKWLIKPFKLQQLRDLLAE